MKNFLSQVAVGFSIALTLCGCGGGSGGGGSAAINTPAMPVIASLKGTVADGHIAGARVFLDLDNSLTQDVGEPEASTGPDGQFSLDTSGLAFAKIRSAQIVATVSSTAQDADDGGLNLSQAGKKPFTLMAPAEAYLAADGTQKSAVVSPLTTLIAHDMQTGNGKSLADAITAVLTRTGLPAGNDLMQDVGQATAGASARQMARTLALAIGEIKALIQQDEPTASDATAYWAALLHVQRNAAALQRALAYATGVTLTENVRDRLTNSGDLQPASQALVREAKALLASRSTDTLNALSSGLYQANTSCIFGAQCSADSGYVRLSVSGSNAASATVGLSGSGNNAIWVKSGSGSSFAFSVDGQALRISDPSNGAGARISVRMQDIGGIRWSAMVDALGLDRSSPAYLAAKAAAQTQQMPVGSALYWLGTVSGSDAVTLLFPARSADSSPHTLVSFAELMAAYPTPAAASAPSALSGEGGVYFTFDSGSTDAGGLLTLWHPSCASTRGAASCVRTGKASYDIRDSVAGYRAMILRIPSPFGSGKNPAYAIKDGVLQYGIYTAAGAKLEDSYWFNATALRAIMDFRGLPTVLAN